MSKPDRWVEFDDVTCTRETDAALLCTFPEVDEALWIPLSQCDLDAGNIHGAGDHGKLVITRWIATQKDLLED